MRFQQTLDKKKIFSAAVNFPMQKSVARTTFYDTTCLTVCDLVHGGTTSRDSGDTHGRRISQLGGQLQHVGSSSRHNTTTNSCWSNSSLFRLLESEGRKRSEQFFSCIPTNRRRTWSLNKSRKLQGTLTQKMSQSKVLQRACLWNHTALVNDAVWEAADKNFGSVCVGC